MHFGLLRLLFAGRFNFEIDSSGLIENKTERMIFMSKIAVVYWSGTGNTEAMLTPFWKGPRMPVLTLFSILRLVFTGGL